MAVTELEENQINDMLYELDMCQDDEKKCANIILDVWNKIWEIMIRENKFSEEPYLLMKTGISGMMLCYIPSHARKNFAIIPSNFLLKKENNTAYVA